MAIKNELARGKCYAAAYAMIEVMGGGRDLRLCHGIATQTKPPHVRMGHAWVERREFGVWFCYDGLYPRTPILRGRYYAIGTINPNEVVRYTRAEARREAARTGSGGGPWAAHIMRAAHAGDHD